MGDFSGCTMGNMRSLDRSSSRLGRRSGVLSRGSCMFAAGMISPLRLDDFSVSAFFITGLRQTILAQILSRHKHPCRFPIGKYKEDTGHGSGNNCSSQGIEETIEFKINVGIAVISVKDATAEQINVFTGIREGTDDTKTHYQNKESHTKGIRKPFLQDCVGQSVQAASMSNVLPS